MNCCASMQWRSGHPLSSCLLPDRLPEALPSVTVAADVVTVRGTLQNATNCPLERLTRLYLRKVGRFCHYTHTHWSMSIQPTD